MFTIGRFVKTFTFIHTHGHGQNSFLFNYEFFLLNKIIIASPVTATTKFKKYRILKRRKDILVKVQDYRDNFLNTNKESCVENTVNNLYSFKFAEHKRE